MPNLHVPDHLWLESALPLGVLERWRVENGELVFVGQVIAVLRIEDVLHDLEAPWSGMLSTFARPQDLIGPGALIGRIEKPAVH
jgi:hypothetical protein